MAGVVTVVVSALALYLSTFGYYTGILDDFLSFSHPIAQKPGPVTLLYSSTNYAAAVTTVHEDAAFFFSDAIPFDSFAATCPPGWGVREGFPARFRNGIWQFRLVLDPNEPALRRMARYLASSRKRYPFPEKVRTYVANYAVSREPAVRVAIR